MLSHNTKKLTPELCRIDVVAVDDIARLWKGRVPLVLAKSSFGSMN